MGNMWTDEMSGKLDEINGKLDALAHMIKTVLTAISDQDARMLAEAEQPTMAHARPHPVAPAPGEVVFGPDMREVEQPWAGEADDRYPLLSTCSCGRQICMTTAGRPWEYCGS